jgi:hypothetical protein
VLAEQMVTDPMAELVVGQVVLAGQQPERGGLDDRIPVACFRADRAVAFIGTEAEVYIGFKPNGTAVAATEIRFDHRFLLCRNGQAA